MVNQRLIVLACLASITLFSFDCSGNPTDQSQISEIASNKGSNNETITSVKPPNPNTVTNPTINEKSTTPTTTPPTSTSTSTPPTTTSSTTTTRPTSTTAAPTPVLTSTIIPSSSTTQHPNVTTTNAPPSTTAAPKHDRSFDLPSFIGGAILALGIAAISYVVYKFYKTRTDPNYRSL